MPSEDSPEGGKRFGLYRGKVIDNADPASIGRVRVQIPGLAEDGTDWAIPLGMPGAGGSNEPGERRGAFCPPPNGAAVAVMFEQGDADSPVYWTGNYGANVGGKSQVPGPVGGYAPPDRATAAPGTPEVIDPADAHLVFAWEWSAFVFVVDSRPGKEKLYFQVKKTGDGIIFDAVASSIEVRAMALISIISDGITAIDGLQVNVKKRSVLLDGKPLLWPMEMTRPTIHSAL